MFYVFFHLVWGADMMAQTREQVWACLMKKRDGSDSDSALDMQRQQIENNQINTLNKCFLHIG